MRLSDIGGLLRGLLVERVKALIEPGDSPRLSWLAFGFLSLLVRFAPSISLVLGAAALAEVTRQTRFFPQRARIAMLVALFVGTFLFHWGDDSSSYRALSWYPVYRWFRLWVWISVADRLTSGFWPFRPMLDAFEEYRSATHDLRWAEMEVDRCRSLVESGVRVAQELANVEIARDRLIRKRDEASDRLHSHGYRARFQRQ